MKKVGIVGTVGIPAHYGGFETLAEHLTREKRADFDFTVYCSALAYPGKQKTHNGAKLRYLPLKANGIQSIFYDIGSMILAVRENDTLLILGISGCIFLPVFKLFSQKKVIVNIDGSEWQRRKWGYWAKRFLKLSEKLAVRYADAVIADNKVIREHVSAVYGRKAFLIPYGADHCRKVSVLPQTMKEFPFLQQPYAFKVSRIEPENNIELILRTFQKFQKLNLVIVGNWSDNSYARELKRRYESCSNIFLLPPVYAQEKLDQLRSNCLIYIHGHSAGGTNPSLVEAMYLGLPVLAYGVSYNKETTGNSALYFDDEDSLTNHLEQLDEKKLCRVAKDMFQIAGYRYTWKDVANQYARLF